LPAEFDSTLVFPLDVGSDEQITDLFVELGKRWDGLDGLVHSIAYAPTEAIEGDFLERHFARRLPHRPRNFVVQLPGAGQGRPPDDAGPQECRARPLLPRRRAHHAELQHHGSGQGQPGSGHPLPGLLPRPEGIRANAISAGPIKTLAASGIGNFGKLLSYNSHNAPLRRNVTIDEVGNAAAFMLSDLASGITGEIMYVDGGMNTVALWATPTRCPPNRNAQHCGVGDIIG
jgi:enoyl-[acyl-carrier protein] reductase I